MLCKVVQNFEFEILKRDILIKQLLCCVRWFGGFSERNTEIKALVSLWFFMLYKVGQIYVHL